MRSPSARILINTVDIYAATSAPDADGGPQWTYPSVPTSAGVRCSVQYRGIALDSEDTKRLTQVAEYHIIFGSDPGLSPRDKVIQTDISPTRTLFVEANPPSEAGRGAAWVVRCVERR